MTPMIRRSGLDLRVERVKRDIKAQDLAAAMGVKPSSLSRLEASRNVTDKAAQRYLTALATFPTVTTPVDGQDAA